MVKQLRRLVNMSILPGESTDGSGRICIHLIVQDEKGPYIESNVLHPVIGADGNPIKQKLEARPTRMRMACSATRTPIPTVSKGVTTVTFRTDDPRAVTCPKCIKSEDYKASMTQLGGG